MSSTPTSRPWRLGRLGAAVVFAVAAATGAAPAAAAPDVGPVMPFSDLRAPGGLEGLAISPSNTLYGAAQEERKIYAVTPDGKSSVFADFGFEPFDMFLIGLVATPDGGLYAAAAGCQRPELNGVWRVSPAGETTLAFPVPTDFCGQSILNALAYDNRGNLYVTDSGRGQVLRLGENGAEVWLEDELLAYRPESLNPVGVDGIAYRRGALWLNNLDTGTIIRVPIQRDGSAGTPTVFAEGLGHPDGHQFDVQGNLWVTNLGDQEWDVFDGSRRNVLLVRPDGTVEVAIPTEALAAVSSLTPASPVFGFGRERRTLFIGGALRDPDDPASNILKIDVGVPGAKLPQFRGRLPRD